MAYVLSKEDVAAISNSLAETLPIKYGEFAKSLVDYILSKEQVEEKPKEE
jgi:hypothetical protein